MIALGTAGVVVIVPEIADYEIRRELIRAGKTAGVDRLNGFIGALQGRYLPITTPAIRLAADLWARSRNAGLTTADARALDADVILAAQALEAGWHESDFVVASVNVRHISRFVPCRSWTEIAPDG